LARNTGKQFPVPSGSTEDATWSAPAAPEAVAGNWQPKSVVLEFPSVQRAKRWYDSDDYRERKAQRQAASSSNMILVEGIQA
jgi:uncharacterized protein (DUF1330 family)